MRAHLPVIYPEWILMKSLSQSVTDSGDGVKPVRLINLMGMRPLVLMY